VRTFSTTKKGIYQVNQGYKVLPLRDVTVADKSFDKPH